MEDSNIAYALHFYAGTHGTDIRTNAESAMSKGIALFITEFGTTDASGGQIDKKVYLDNAKTWLDWADFKGISWANWSLASIPEPCSILKPGVSNTGNWADSDLSESGTWIRDRLLARPKNQNSDSARIIINIQGKGIVTLSPNSTMVLKGTKVIFTAVAESGWEFKSWGASSTVSEAKITLTVDENTSLIANFVSGAGTNMLKNGDFSESTGWSSWVDTSQGNNAVFTFTDSRANISISNTDTLNWGIQLSQSGLELDSGAAYTITLDAWSTGERTLFIGLSSLETWHFQGGSLIDLTSEKKSSTITITPDSSTDAGIIQINAGGDTLPVFIDNIRMYKSSGATILVNRAKKKAQSNVCFNRISNKIYWTSTSQKTRVALADVRGRILQSTSGSRPIHVSNVASGLFLLIATDGLHREIYQFVK